MSTLSAKARAIIEQGRGGLRPAPGERERLEALIDAKLAAGATVAGGGKLLLAAKAWQVALGVALVGGVATFALREPSEPPKPAVSVVAAAPVPLSARDDAQPPIPLQSLPMLDEPLTDAPPARPVATAREQKDQLALEVALLSRATSALRAGRAGDALQSLDEHKRRFPSGVLAVDRRAARAQALCLLERVSEGQAELSRLAPESPAAARTRQVCSAAAAKTKRQ